MTPLTARIHEPGSVYFDSRRGRLSHVPTTHLAVTCEACAWALHTPLRFGYDRAEQLRREHLGTAHLTGLITGQVVFTMPSSSGIGGREHVSSGREVSGTASAGVLGTTETQMEGPYSARCPSAQPGRQPGERPQSVVPLSRSG